MIKLAKRYFDFFARYRYGFSLAAVLAASALTGILCVWFMWSFDFVLSRRLDFKSIGSWCWVTTPLLFLCSIELIKRAAPCADGSGIPQVIFAAEHYDANKEAALMPLTSWRTMSVKVLAILLGLLAGASTGREGPTVHVATCFFVSVLLLLRRFAGLRFDMRSAYVAGGAAGLAAAFNTPLAGVTFAIEELSTDYFANIKEFVLMAIVFAGIAAKSLTGEYAYFGRLPDPDPLSWPVLLLIGVIGGGLGALFSVLIVRGRRAVMGVQRPLVMYAVVVLMSLGLLALASLSRVDLLGPGNLVAQTLVRGESGSWVLWFPFLKAMTTFLTYWSGIAGGIFAPCLSMGAAVGAGIGRWFGAPTASCALVGMAAFLSGAIQAPITSFVIIFEMTGHHQMLLPIMLAAMLAFVVARVLGARHLYQDLSSTYRFLLDDKKA